MAKYQLSSKTTVNFPLSSVFVDYYMPKANPTFVKVYLYGMRMCYAEHAAQMEPNVIANALDMLQSDVIQAWKYWASVGAVTLHREENGESFSVEFLELTPPAKKNPAPAHPAEKPMYSMNDISSAAGRSKKLANMFALSEQLLGKPLSQTDARTLYSLYDWLGLPHEVILILIEHCASIGKTSMRYIEKVAMAWADQGINTVKRAEKYLKENSDRLKLFRKYKRMLKISDRDLSDTEQTYILNWAGSMNMSEELILAAYEKTVLYTGKMSFPYMNRILTAWQKEGIKSVADIPVKDSTKPPKERTASSNSFNNYTQTGSYDYEAMEKEAMEKIINYQPKEG